MISINEVRPRYCDILFSAKHLVLIMVLGVYQFSSNLPAPINAGPNPQTKEGDLTVKGNFTTEGILTTESFKMLAGAEADKVLTTNAFGVATWQEAAGGGSGTVTNFVFTNSTGITGTVATPTITPTLSLALTSAAVGLGNVNNTADTAKPVSTAQQTALNLKANLASPTFTGTPAAPTAAAGTNSTQLATTAFVQTAVGSCPSGFTAIGSYCIQTNEAPGGAITWFAASDYCHDNYSGATLCSWSQWYNACKNNKLTNPTNNYEWVDDSSSNASGTQGFGALVVGSGGCEVKGSYDVVNRVYAFRCCK